MCGNSRNSLVRLLWQGGSLSAHDHAPPGDRRRKGAKSGAARQLEEARRELARTPQLSGISRAYRPRDDDGDKLPPESTRVQVRAEDILAAVAAAMTRMLDVTLTKDVGNTRARADVKLADGTILLADVPVTWLLTLEKQLSEIGSFLARLPLLDPAENWDLDEVSGVYRTPAAVTMRSKKIPRNHVVAEATREHPAQVQVYTEDVPVGEWSTVKFSGALPAQRVRALTGRCAELLRAVRYAREEANATEVVDQRAGDLIFGYLLAA